MKLLKITLIFSVSVILACSCKKEILSSPGTASLTVINASADNPAIAVSFADTPQSFYIYTSPVYYGNFAEYGSPAGKTPLLLISSSDTTHTLFKGSFNLKAGAFYSFYISGSQGKQLDTLLMEDNIVNHTDSTAGVRFINFSPAKLPISINLEGNSPSQTEITNLVYKQISTFKTYTALNGVTSYNFEIRDQASGDLLTTFTWNLTLFKNNTIVVSGSQDASNINQFVTFQVNNF
jgi:hypothetical protein